MTWPAAGVAIFEKVLPDELVDAYSAVRAPLGPDGYSIGTPYMSVPELADLALCEPVVQAVEEVVGEPVAMHLNLTGWVSTERTWHQDDYLNPFPNGVGDRYCGAWFALDDIDPRSGPFEYVPASHNLPFLTQQEVLDRLDPAEAANPDWPWIAERFVTEYWDEVITSTGAPIERFEARRGDLLLWHSRLLHRGSRPEVPGLERRSLIVHYSAVDARPDMGGWGNVVEHGAGRYFRF